MKLSENTKKGIFLVATIPIYPFIFLGFVAGIIYSAVGAGFIVGKDLIYNIMDKID